MRTAGFDYLGRSVKMEFGSLTDQRPVGTHRVLPWMAEEFPGPLQDFRCELVALELERTFWEKATILHAEHHRHPGQPMRDRFPATIPTWRLWPGTTPPAVLWRVAICGSGWRIGRAGSSRPVGLLIGRGD